MGSGARLQVEPTNTARETARDARASAAPVPEFLENLQESLEEARPQDHPQMQFQDLALSPALLKAVAEEGYTTPTPIQQQSIPACLEGRDVLGCAQTGTGKTASFALPILHHLSVTRPPSTVKGRPIRALILTPTRELASQIAESFDTYGRHTGLTNTVIFGGVGQGNQERALRDRPDVLVATPGRLLDLIGQRLVSFKDLEVFVLDEADRMLDMGFLRDVQRIIQVIPQKRQTLFFSATMPPDIQRLADQILRNPVKVEVTPVSSTAERVEQRVYFVDQQQKRHLLAHVLKDPSMKMTLVFTRTKHGANRVTEQLNKAGVGAAVIHGNKSQNARERALLSFREGSSRVLVATDIAARGIDIDGITHVVNYELPNIPESYVHRIGRTGRAGASGIALSFVDREERSFLKDIERTIRRSVPVVNEHPFPPGSALVHSDDEEARPPRPQQRRGGGGGGGGGRSAGPRGGGGGGGRGPRRTGGGASRGPSQGSARPAQSASSSGSQGQGPRAAPAPAASAAPPARRQQRVYSKW